jgi:hypothetical protein
MLVLTMEFSRGTADGAEALRPPERPEAGTRAGVSRFQRRRATHSLKTEQRIARDPPRPALGGSCLSETVAYDGDRRGRRQASDQLGVPLTDVRGSNSLERR